MVKKVKCVLSYDGTNFSGFQIQPDERTVQGELELALKKLHKGKAIRLHPSGRTDAGVHAKRQVIHFESPLEITELSWVKALNAMVPDDIVILETSYEADDFHARYNACEKEYRYYVLNTTNKDVFKRHYVYQFPYSLNIERIKQACKYFEGKHDFTTFSSAKATIKGSKVRTLTEVSCQKNGNELEFIFRGDGFLYNMVRIIVGTLLDIGQGRQNLTDISLLLEKRDRQLLGKTAPPEGLYLWNVHYEKKI